MTNTFSPELEMLTVSTPVFAVTEAAGFAGLNLLGHGPNNYI
jgi:hypothetical protein